MNDSVSMMTEVHRIVYHEGYSTSSVQYRGASILYLQELRLCCAAPQYPKICPRQYFVEPPALLEHSTGLRLTYL